MSWSSPPESPAAVAQAVCYRALKDVLTYFLGEVNPAHLEVNRITSLTRSRVEVSAYTVAELEQADFEAVSAPPPPAPTSSLSLLTSWPLTTADGQNLRVSFAVEPVMDLKAWAMAGHRIESRILNLQTGQELNGHERRKLLPRDFEKIDLAALERGRSRLTDGGSPTKPKLIIQLSFASLSNGRARLALLGLTQELQGVLKQAAICELVDVGSGIPVGWLTEVTSLVRGFFRAIWIQVQPTREAVESAIAAKVSGLTVRAADLGEDAESISANAREFVALVNGRNSFLTAASLPTPELLIAAMNAGFTHATLRAKSGLTPVN